MTNRSVMALICIAIVAGCDGGSPLVSAANGSAAGDTDSTTTTTTIDTAADGTTTTETSTTTTETNADGTSTTTTTTTTTQTPDTGSPIAGALPPGTANPEPDQSIFRTEEDSAANSIRYDQATDSFFVDGLPFDGNQVDGDLYARATFGTLGTNAVGTFALYEAPATVLDPLTGSPIDQFSYHALYGVSTSGETEFAIIRNSQFIDYGFGGFIYQRNGSVTLPAEGQGNYVGEYAGIRDSNITSEVQFVSGQATAKIDFSGFRNNCLPPECDNASRIEISNRQIFDVNGTNITPTYLAELGVAEIPVLKARIGPNQMDINGEMTGEAFSSYVDADGAVQTYEEGNYYAIMAGDHTALPGGEIVGIFVVTASDPTTADPTPNFRITRETGGFLVARQ